MALVVSSIAGEEKPRRSSFRGGGERKQPWMLKDYLKDDMSSCSSNGFRSFPRRQCCVAAVRNIIENDIVCRRRSKPPPKRISRSRSVSSAFQRASVAVINAVKLLPFKIPAEPPVSSGEGKKIMPRSLSKKLFKRSFWKKKKSASEGGGGERKAKTGGMKKNQEECDEIERWISSGVVSAEKYQPSDLSNDTTVTNASTTTTTSNSNSNSDGKSVDSWSDITFTSEYLTSLSENDAVERREKTPAKDDHEEEEVSRRGGVTAAPVEPAVAKNAWLNEVSKKEQLSPISILDFPDTDEGSLSPFTLRISRLKDTQERLMKKLGRFESLAALGLEPLNLGSTLEDRSPKISNYSCSAPSYTVLSDTSEEEEPEEEEEEDEEQSQENKAEKKAKNLLNMMKTKMPTKSTSNKFEPNNLLLDFFRENIINKDDDTLLKEAEDWLNGDHDNLILGWKVKDKREAYIRDMEGGRWARSDVKLEKDEVVAELGAEVLAHLIEESLQECCS